MTHHCPICDEPMANVDPGDIRGAYRPLCEVCGKLATEETEMELYMETGEWT